MVIWVIGLSAAGKTVLGSEIARQWRDVAPNTVMVDGDEIRAVFKHDRGEEPYSLEGRKKNADRICELCAWLDRQNINVVCSILSIFEESRQWNRKTYTDYFEVFVDVPMKLLVSRDKKNLYGPALAGKVKNVVGVDMAFCPPQNPDFVFENIAEKSNFSEIAENILRCALEDR